MKKTKRLLSMLTALAITATSFAAMVIPASAAETAINGAAQNFDSLSGGSLGWTTAGDGMTYDLVDNGAGKALSATAKTGGGGYSGTATFPTPISLADNVVKVQFDWQAKMVGVSDYFDTVLQDSAGKGIFSVGVLYGGNSSNPKALLRINGKSVTPDTDRISKWSKVTAVIDYETKRVLSLEVAETDGTSVASVKDAPFLDKEAGNAAAGFGLNAVKGSGNLGDNYTYIDNFDAFNITEEYYKVTFNVKDSESNPVEGATVTFDGTEYTTDTQGQVVVKHKAGDAIAYTVHKDGYEANEEQGDDASGSINITNTDVVENVTYSKAVYTPQAKTVTITGGQKVMTAAHTAGKSVTSKPFAVTVLDQMGVDQTENATVTWAVAPADKGVTVDAEGVVTVADTFKPESGHVQNFTLTPTVTINGAAAAADATIGTATIGVSDYLFYEPGVGGSSYSDDVEAQANGSDTYISTPATAKTTTITLPDPIKFEQGTAWQMSFQTTLTNKNVYTYRRDFKLVSSEDENILDLGFINTDIGDATDATWNSSKCDFAAGKVYGSISAFGTWQSASILFKTNSRGKTTAKLTIGDQETDLGEITATDLAKIQLAMSLANTSDRFALFKDIVIEEVDATQIGIEGVDNISSVTGAARTKEYVLDALVVQDEETFTWTTDSQTVTIKANEADGGQTATLTVPDGQAKTTVNVTVTSSLNSTEAPKTATKAVNVEPANPEFSISGSTTLNYAEGATSQYTVDKVTDQFDDDITDLVTPTWTLDSAAAIEAPSATFTVADADAGAAKMIIPTYAEGKLTNVDVKDVTVTAGQNKLTNVPAGAKVMLWKALDGEAADGALKPLAAVATASAGGDAPTGTNYIDTAGLLTLQTKPTEALKVEATILGEKVTLPVTVDTYSIIVPPAASISVADIVSYGATTYNVVFSDGTVATKTEAENNITLTTDEIAKGDQVEVIPVYKFDLGGQSTEGYTNVNAVKANGYGFTAAPTAAAGTGTGIQSKGVDLSKNSFEVDLPDGRYDMTFYKALTGRTHIRVNGYYTANEADFTDGDNGTVDPITAPGVYTKLDVNVTGGVAVVTADDWDNSKPSPLAPLVSAVEITKKSDMEPRKTHIWIAGDSTVCNYRPTVPKKDSAAGTRRTGWGQLLEYYLGDSVIVDNFAHSGDWADQWYKNTFPSVIQSAEAGDYLIIQFGINDRTRTPDHAVVQAALSNMIDECRAKGVIPVLQTPELCPSQYGEQVKTEHTKPTGSGHGAYFDDTRTVAKDKNTLFIDLADITGDLWAKMGKTWVTQNYFLSQSVVDNQHMAYIGAKLVAGIVAAQISDQKAAGKTGAAGETFAGIPVNAVSDSTITYTDFDPNDDGEQTDKAENQTVTVKLPAYELDAAE